MDANDGLYLLSLGMGIGTPFVRRFLYWINVLSLDVVLGSVGSAYFVYKVLGVVPVWGKLGLMGMGVWLLYLGDRVFGNSTLMIRHRLLGGNARFWKRIFWIGVLIVLIVSSRVLTRLDWVWVLVLVLMLGVYYWGYFCWVRGGRVFRYKEIVLALAYGYGVCMLPFSGLERGFRVGEGGVFLLGGMVLTAYYNVLILSLFERGDRGDCYSIVHWISEDWLRILIRYLFVFSVVLGVVFVFRGFACLGFVFLSVMMMYSILVYFEKYWVVGERFRLVMDMVPILFGLVGLFL